jgi:hypothetical protein
MKLSRIAFQFFLPLLLVTFGLLEVGAASGLSDKQMADLKSDEDYRKKARLKLYPGGIDEQELKIQSLLLPISRKMVPQAEAPIEEQPEE